MIIQYREIFLGLVIFYILLLKKGNLKAGEISRETGLNRSYLYKMLEDLIAVCKSNLRNLNEKLITKAFKLSFEAHKNHFRASGEPYFLHPYEVTMIVANEIPLDDISVASSLLHDVVEDTDISIGFIEKEFGKVGKSIGKLDIIGMG